jgi:hypothetical protein
MAGSDVRWLGRKDSNSPKVASPIVVKMLESPQSPG